MFNNISWQGYWLCLVLISAGYYLVIYLLYFRNDFQIILNRQYRPQDNNPFDSSSSSKFKHQSHGQPLSVSESNEFETPDNGTDEGIVYACIDEMDAFFEQSKKTGCVKEEMICSLQKILKKYPTLKESEYKQSLTNVIVTQCEHICSIHLDLDDVVRVWFGE
jgi:hypothetical protein